VTKRGIAEVKSDAAGARGDGGKLGWDAGEIGLDPGLQRFARTIDTHILIIATTAPETMNPSVRRPDNPPM